MNIEEANAQYYKADSTANKSAVNLADNFDDFLTMLTTQLQNQDPLNPTDSNEFTNQLVSFTGVEQSIATNQHLEALIQLQSISQQNNEATTLISYLGKTVGTDLNVAKLDGEGAAWNINLQTTADEVTYSIYDKAGNKVHTESAGTLGKGDQTFTWDGSLVNGGQAPEGAYYLVVDAKTDGGSQVDVNYSFKGLASKVETIDGQPVLMVGGVPLGLANITTVEVANTDTDGA
ncbi:flagellar hook assembly protein FlgD [Sneathiella limimaris]|uniref:flagellar hook assembly protein FlgD n=1 Tax=Sneathiella limimaris TaxID=1964213 RepID=UPI00146A8986|nr:flagellar hook assembly protein FlgD [Sneathiella limimaris]